MPSLFPLKIKTGTEHQVQASAGGGISVAEAGHGDVREIFCTKIKMPKGKSPKTTIIEPPTGGQVKVRESEEEVVGEDHDDSDSGAENGKKQYYRHDGWLKQIRGLIEAHSEIEVSTALSGFIDAKHRL